MTYILYFIGIESARGSERKGSSREKNMFIELGRGKKPVDIFKMYKIT